jgi:protein SCO1/2
MKRFALALTLLAAPLIAQTASEPAQLPGRVSITQKLDTQVPLDLMFRDETGKIVRIRDYFNHGRPVLLNFMYYRCPMLCSTVMEGVTSALTELKFNIGEQFDVITVSIDPRDEPAAAAEKKETYIKRYGRLNAGQGWHFLTGSDASIKPLANAVGFEYAYDPKTDNFAHGTMLAILTPEGRMSRYLLGFQYKPRDLRLGIVEASQGKVGTVSDAVLLLCYHYNPSIGKYSRSAMTFVRAGGVATMMTLAGFIFVMLRKDRKQA